MNKKHRRPFQSMTSKNWQNLALAAALAFSIILIGFFLMITNIQDIDFCGHLAFDYCAFWSGGRIINQQSIADIYDLDLLLQFQKNIYPQSNNSNTSFRAVEIPYLPIFMLPFQLLSLLDLPYSYIVWTLINLIGFISYLRFFTKKVADCSLPFRYVLLIMLSVPVFLNLILGQLNIWLGICAGEFIRAILSDKPTKAGVWLGGWLLKPQMLVLIIPFLLMHRSFKVIKGFILSTFAVLMVSFALIGANGFLNLKNILLESAGGGATSNPQLMMNWRMMGWHIGSLTSSTIEWIIIIVGSVVTVYVTIFIFRRRMTANSSTIAFLGIFAATGLVTWHSHFSMSIVLIPLLILLIMKNHYNKNILLVWVLMPILVKFIFYISILFISEYGQLGEFLEGLRGFISNLIIFVWAIIAYPRAENETTEEILPMKDISSV